MQIFAAFMSLKADVGELPQSGQFQPVALTFPTCREAAVDGADQARQSTSRKRRIAGCAGVQVHEVNKLLAQFKEMQKMTKMMMHAGSHAKIMRNMVGMLPGMR